MVTSNAVKKLADTSLEEISINIPKDELKWCTVSLHEILNKSKRIDATVYDIDARHAHEVIKNVNGLKYHFLMIQ